MGCPRTFGAARGDKATKWAAEGGGGDEEGKSVRPLSLLLKRKVYGTLVYISRRKLHNRGREDGKGDKVWSFVSGTRRGEEEEKEEEKEEGAY